MVSTENITKQKHKYITICERTVRVKIERGDDVHLKHFQIRSFLTLADAIKAAINWRDEVHLRCYGIPVLERVHQLTRRKSKKEHTDPKTGEPLPILPPGLAYGYHRGQLLYVVASFQQDNRPQRRRFSIKKLGITQAIETAQKSRLDGIETDR